MEADSAPDPRASLSRFVCAFATLVCLLFLLVGLRFDPETALNAFTSSQPGASPQRQIEDEAHTVATSDRLAGVPGHQIVTSLLANIPRIDRALQLSTPNYREDTAIREALLADPHQWRVHTKSGRLAYQASNALTVYVVNPSDTQAQPLAQREQTLLTARSLLGLWVSRRFDPQFSLEGHVVIRADEILAWRGVQKHQRIAYPGSQKRFTDGYQWKHKQQVHQDLMALSRYRLSGQQYIVCQGRVETFLVDAPYLSITPVENNANIAGYLVAPGPWISAYEAHHMLFLARVPRQILQLNPRNDYLALRMAFYLVEHWRQEARSGAYQEPLLMARLLAASMISVDKANLTSRFAPRVEGALQKLYTQHILGEPPVNLSGIDRTKAHWGQDWLASSWRLVPPQDIICFYTRGKK
ncbi:MAG TPA: hypothetical protein VKR06_00480 [Ktedonosporobacter sp.]|nr:hypothetical protein [Ktedonosporobacter sp.]